MLPEQVEQLKRQYTGQYVIVDALRPELARFHNMVGQIKTINMSGRALVEFDGDNNRGWYDIAPNCLKVVDKPPPKADKEKPASPAAPKPGPKPAPKV